MIIIGIAGGTGSGKTKISHHSTLRTLLLLLALVCTNASTHAYDFCVDGIYYKKKNGSDEVSVTYNEKSKYSGNVTIPNAVTYNGKTYTVSAIGLQAFYECTELKSVNIPNTVTSIGMDAFNACNLRTMVIPNSVTNITNSSFLNCVFESLTIEDGTEILSVSDVTDFSPFPCKNLYLGRNISYTYSGNGHSYSRSLTFGYIEKLTIGNCVTYIGNNAFCWSNELTEVTIPNNVAEIGNSAFEYCTSLSKLTISDGVTHIGSSAFSRCTALTDVTVGSGITEIRGDEFTWNNQMQIRMMSETPPELKQVINIESIEVPLGHTFDYAMATNWHEIPIIFAVNNGTRYYSVPYYATGESIVTINGQLNGAEAEEGSIVNVMLKNGYQENPIYESVKYHNQEILGLIQTNQVFQFSCVKEHQLNAVYSESESQDNTFVISVAESGTLINLIGIENILKVRYLKLSGNLNGTDILAIRKMTNLLVLDMNEAHIVDGGASYYQNYTTSKDAIGPYFFKDITNLAHVFLPSDIKAIKSYAFSDMTNLAEITIPQYVTLIDANAFSGCNGLTVLQWNAINCNSGIGYTYNLTEITIGDAVSSLPGSFARGSKITAITIPSSVTSIGGSAFSGCTGLTSVTIPNSVTTVGGSAFYDCTGLLEVTIPESINTISSSMFGSCTGLTNVNIPNCVTIIDYAAFTHCTGLENIIIPNSVTYIGSEAFRSCTGLTNVTIPNNVTTIGSSAFENCTRLTRLTIDDGTTMLTLESAGYKYEPKTFDDSPIEFLYLGRNLSYNSNYYNNYYTPFKNKSTLKTLIIGNHVTSIGSSVFSGCTGLTSVTIPNNVTSIGGSAFSGCTGLTSVTIPNSVTSIGGSAFSGCTGLASVTIPNSITSISGSTFSGCTGLTNVTIPNSVTSIGGSAFAGCSGLNTIHSMNTTPPLIQESTFDATTEQNATLYVPSGCRTIYWLHPYWENFVNINEETQAVIGDVDGDGDVSIADVSHLIDMLLNGNTGIDDYPCADVNLDGTIGIADVSELIDMLLNASE